MPNSHHRQVTIEDRVLLVCPHCWTADELAAELPELSGMPVSRHLCPTHFQVLLTAALECRMPCERSSGPHVDRNGERRAAG